jgi:integrase
MALIPPPLIDIDMANYCLPPPFLAADWTVRLAAPWRFPDHINVLEARALGAVPSFAVPGTRVLLWCDNTAVMHSTNKGRSSKFPLLRRLRAFSATVLATGLLPVVRYVPSAANPADAPSRIYASAGAKLFGKAYSSDNMGDGPDPNFLINASVGSATAVEYSKAVTGLLEWMALEGLRPRSLSSLDNAVAEYFLHLYFDGVEGSGRQLAANTVAGIHLRIPRARNRLHRTYLSLKGWKRLVPPVPAPPFTWDTALAVAASLQHQGLPEMASGLLLSFDAYLRVSELCNLRKADVADFNDPRIGQNTSMYLRLREAKTGKNQWVSVKRVELVLLIRCLLKGKSAESRVFDFSPATFRRRLRKTCCALGLPNYTPHSLRHGGATCDHLSGVALEDIMLRGRWASSSSARRYIQAGRALLLSTQVPASVLALSRFAAANFRTVFSCAARDH